MSEQEKKTLVSNKQREIEERLLCRPVAALIIFLPKDFKPHKGRLKDILEKMKDCDCMDPPRLVCSNKSGLCEIVDGRHRIYAAQLLGKTSLLVSETWEPR